MFDAARALRAAETQLLETHDEPALGRLLGAAVTEASRLADIDEARMRLDLLADLCAQVPGPDMVDALMKILDHEDPALRVSAGEALLDVGYDRYAEVARGVERALERPAGPALLELPWLLTEIGEPSALTLLRRFLARKEPDVVAASIEALVSLGDPDAIALLEPMVTDTRVATVEGFEAETTATIGELAQQAIDELEPPDDE